MSGSGINVYPFHDHYPGLPDLFHVACPRCPDFGFCGERDRADAMAVEHARTCKEGAGAGELSAPIEGAVEVVADALHVPGCNHHTGGPSECYSRALSAVTALATAGLVATDPQWGTEIPGAHVIPWPSEEEARKMGGLTGHSVKVRYASTTPWGDA